MYSLFNVTSLVIKLFLNFLIAKLNIRCPGSTGTCPGSTGTCLRHRRGFCPFCCSCCRPHKATGARVVVRDRSAASRRNAIVAGQRAPKPRSTRTIHPLSVADLQRRQNGVVAAGERMAPDDSSPAAESVPSSRRSSNEVSIRDFLKVSKISMAMMQKQLYETAHRGSAAGAHSTTAPIGGRSQSHSAASGSNASASNSGLHGGVGPLAILNHKLCHDEL